MIKRKPMSEETKRKMSEARKIAWSDVEKRNVYLEKMNTEDYKQKQRDSLKRKGNPSKNILVRDKISKSKKGILRSIETKKLISIKTKEKMNNEIVKEKLRNREKLFGDKNKNWKGGISFEPYCEVWSDKEYKATIKRRDHNVCQNCGITKLLSLKIFECDLNIHHIDYNKKNCIPTNLITVCRTCNSKANGNREFWNLYYKNIMKEKYKNAKHSVV